MVFFKTIYFRCIYNFLNSILQLILLFSELNEGRGSRQWGTDIWLTSPLGKAALVCSIHHFSWCEYPYHVWFQITSTSLNIELGRNEYNWSFKTQLVRTHHWIHVRKKQLYMTFWENRKSEYGQGVNDLGNIKYS